MLLCSCLCERYSSLIQNGSIANDANMGKTEGGAKTYHDSQGNDNFNTFLHTHFIALRYFSNYLVGSEKTFMYVVCVAKI